MYGGIHFDCDIDDGLEQGKCVGNYYLENIKTKAAHTEKKGTEAK